MFKGKKGRWRGGEEVDLQLWFPTGHLKGWHLAPSVFHSAIRIFNQVYVPSFRSASDHGSRTRDPRDDGFKVG